MKILDTVDLLETSLADIPCLIITSKRLANPAKSVIYYHGWSSKIENTHLISSILANWGYRVVVPEVINHGKRGSLDYNSPKVLNDYFWPTVLQSLQEFKPLVENLRKSSNLEQESISVVGNSMGGFIAAGCFALNPWVKVLVNINGSCAWQKADELFQAEDFRTDAATLAEISKYDPLQRIEQLVQRPMLLLHGDADRTVPIDSQRYFYQQVKDCCPEVPPQVRLIEIPKLNHLISLGMIEEIINFLDLYL